MAELLENRGCALAGTVQTNTEPVDRGRCDMDVRVLGTGSVIRISQSLGPGARGCRLDQAALERAVSEVLVQLDTGAEIVIINKFGKHEAEGRGFRPVIADALARGIPVVTAVNRYNLESFLEFSGGIAEKLSSNVVTLASWLQSQGRVAAA